MSKKKKIIIAAVLVWQMTSAKENKTPQAKMHTGVPHSSDGRRYNE